MKHEILPIQRLMNVCAKEKVRSAKSIASGILLPALIWCTGAKQVLEIGTLEGFTALAIGMQLELMGGKRRLVVSDIHAKWVNHSVALLKKHAPSVEVQGVIGDSTKTNWGKCLPKNTLFDFAYIDGDHSFEAVFADLRCVSIWIAKRGGMLLHDYINHPKCGIVEALYKWKEESAADWSFVPVPAAMGAATALVFRDAPKGLPVGSTERVDGV